MLLFPRSLLTKECLWDPFQDMMFMPWDSVSVISSTGVWGTGHIHTKWEEMDLTWKGTLTISSLVYCIIHLQYTIISMTWTDHFRICLLNWAWSSFKILFWTIERGGNKGEIFNQTFFIFKTLFQKKKGNQRRRETLKEEKRSYFFGVEVGAGVGFLIITTAVGSVGVVT